MPMADPCTSDTQLELTAADQQSLKSLRLGQQLAYAASIQYMAQLPHGSTLLNNMMTIYVLCSL
jgi:hypothetical protein